MNSNAELLKQLKIDKSHKEAHGGGGGPQARTVLIAALAVLVVLALYTFIDYACLDSTQGPNRYGRSPKGVGGDSDGKLAEVFA